MKQELEICVRANDSNEKIEEKLKKGNFNLKEDFILKDLYFIKTELFKKDDFEKLSDYILIRENVGKRIQLVHKSKKYNKNQEIVEETSSKCDINNLEQAKGFLLSLGYIEFIELEDHIKLYANKEHEIYVQKVGNNLFFEIEADTIHISHQNGKTIEDLKNILIKYNLSFDDSNLFISKAKLRIEGKI